MYIDAIGADLKESLFLLYSQIKEELVVPEIMENANITSIYKGKGQKNDIQNERGIFGMNIFRSLLLKLIYNYEYENIDSKMSDSNVGGRKRKNIRNHLFIVNGIINETIKLKTNVDIEILDFRQCFDSMWLDETINDLFEAGLNNDNLNVIYKLNEKNKVAVLTPHGSTERVTVNKIVMQGENLAPLECSVQVDTFGKECLAEEKYLFFYRGTVPVPPLSMVDDLLCISACGINSLLINSFINVKSNQKKLQFGESKCHKIHIGKNKAVCPDISIDKWKTKQIDTIEIDKPSVEDEHDGLHLIEEANQEKYLGDLISNSGKNDKNIEARVKKGYGIVKQIASILEEQCFGKYFFKVAMILRESLFINSVLLNSEVWYNMSKSNIEELEKLDNILLKKILQVGTSVPSVMLHLDLGTLPIRYILKTRRLMFLQYILKEEESSLLYTFLLAQMDSPKDGDWWLTVLDDISELQLDISLDDIKRMSKECFKKKVKHAASAKAFTWLNEKKQNLKKIKNVCNEKFEMNQYFSSSILSTDQKKILFQLRSKMLPLKSNYHNMYKDDFCPLCVTIRQEYFTDNQEHLLNCKVVNETAEVTEIEVDYNDIFSENISKQEKITIILDNKFNKRKKLETGLKIN